MRGALCTSFKKNNPVANQSLHNYRGGGGGRGKLGGGAVRLPLLYISSSLVRIIIPTFSFLGSLSNLLIHFLDISCNSEHHILDFVPHQCERKKGEGAIFMPSRGFIVRRPGIKEPHLCEWK